MTALAGLWRLEGRPDAGSAAVHMLAAQKIYGPHVSDFWDGGSIALGRALYQLLPEDSHDRQPLQSADGRLILVADVRLDNREEILGDLAIPNELGRQLSDAAVLLAAFERWDERCLDRILGDFAFVIWDMQKRKLLLARDPLGQRPLHYHRGPGLFAFASMPKGLHALPEIPRAPDEERVAEFVVLLPESGSRTFFKGIERVESGHVVTVSANGVSARRYWDTERKPIRLKSSEEYAEAVRHHVDRATKARLRGTGAEVGAHLSAGLDSSVVAATAARLLEPAGKRVIAFTGTPIEGFPRAATRKRILDESAHAAATAAMHANMEHVLVPSPRRSPLQDLDSYFFLFEQPVMNLCNGPWINAINDSAAKRNLKVMLTGFQGNMSLSYNGLQALPQYLARGQWLRWAREVWAGSRTGYVGWKNALSSSIGPYVSPGMWIWLNRVARGVNWDVTSYTPINPRKLQELDIPARARERGLDLSYRPRKDDFETRLWALRRIDLGNFNKGTLAGWGFDQRHPLMDVRLIEFCLNVPPSEFYAGGVHRALARSAFADRLPAEVLKEKRRGQQGPDWHEHLNAAREQVREEIERLEENEIVGNTLDVSHLRKLVEEWPEGGWEREQTVTSYRLVLLRAISTGHFLRKASGSNR